MKRQIIALLALYGLFSCSTDNDTPDASITPGGTFMSVVDGIEVHIADVRDGQCQSFTVWQNDGTRFTFSGFDTNGSWPKYTYSNNTFQMSATYNNEATEFVADYSGVLRSDNTTLAFEAKGAKFTLFWMPLDANGDGIPDVLQ